MEISDPLGEFQGGQDEVQVQRSPLVLTGVEIELAGARERERRQNIVFIECI